MNRNEVFVGGGRNGDARDAFGRWQGGEELERQVLHGLSKFGPVGAVPGIDRIERFKRRHASVFHHTYQVEACVRDRSRAIGEADQGQDGSGCPDFGVLRAGGFERGQQIG